MPPPRLENDFKYCLYFAFHSLYHRISHAHENQYSCRSCGQVSKTAKKLQGLKVRSFGIILHKIGQSVFWFDVLEIAYVWCTDVCCS